MTRYSRLVLGAALALVVVVAALAWGFSLSGRNGASAHLSDVSMRAYQRAVPAAGGPPPQQELSVVPINGGKPCLQLRGKCGQGDQQTVNPQTNNTISVSGKNWNPALNVTVFLIKGAGNCNSDLSVFTNNTLVNTSGTFQVTLALPTNARDGDTYRVCAQQMQGKRLVGPTPNVPLLIHVSEPGANPFAFDVYSAAALLLVVISALAGAPELARMLSRIGGQPGA